MAHVIWGRVHRYLGNQLFQKACFFFFQQAFVEDFLLGQNEGKTDERHKCLSLMIRDFTRRQISGEIITTQQEKR